MNRAFCIVGPTATGKSELAADLAVRLGGEIVSADAFQIYEGFDVLSGKPEKAVLNETAHHLIGAVSVNEEMSAAKYRALALPVIADISSRGKLPVLVGGSGLYVKALTDGLDALPPPDSKLREELNQLTTEELLGRLGALDPAAMGTVDLKNRRRVIRAIEIATTSGKPASAQRSGGREGRKSATAPESPYEYHGVFVFRDRDELYRRINNRVEAMLTNGAIDEVRAAPSLSKTVAQMIGVKDIQKYLSGDISRSECVTRIQQATRRYAKRQLTWFRHQTSFVPLNLSLLSNYEAVQWVLRQAIVRRAVND